MISLIIPGPPIGKQRAHVCKSGHAFTPAKTVNYEALIKQIFAVAYPDHKPWTGTTLMTIRVFLLPSEEAARKKKRFGAYDKPTRRPDLDNIIKIVCDALNGLAYADDKQIVALMADKSYDDKPRLEVTAEEIA